MGEIIKKRNYSIDYFKYFCALLIIIIHLKPFSVISGFANTLSVETLPRIAVPFFFVVSGFYFSEKLLQGKNPLKKYALKIITVYTFWSAVYAARLILIEIKNRRLNAAFFKELLVRYLFLGTSEHLWYCISLLYAVCLLTILFKIGAKKAIPVLSVIVFAIGVSVKTYYNHFGIYVSLLRVFHDFEHSHALFRITVFGTAFVFLGYFISANRERLIKDGSRLYIFLAAAAVLHIAEKTLNLINGDDPLINITLYPLVALIMLALLKKADSRETFFSPYARNASSFTYYSHMIALDALGFVIPYQPVRYFAIVAVTLAGAVILTKINNKKLNYIMM